jgi:hypothetical protein
LKHVKKKTTHEENKEAEQLGDNGAMKDTPDEIDMNVDSPVRITGAKLSKMTDLKTNQTQGYIKTSRVFFMDAYP